MECRICGHAAHERTYAVREMMYGTREEFTYVECAACGCVQIAEIPADLERHYPSDYYSLTQGLPGRAFRAAKAARARHALGDTNTVGAALEKLVGPPPFAEWTRRAGADRTSSILDVGAGDGYLLSRMADAGFVHLRGIDPFTVEGGGRSGGLTVERATIDDIEGRFDLVMFHHSFEHIADQEATLRRAATLIRPGGCVLLRMPVVGGYAWRTYGTDWVQFDAPRHLHLHSERSLAVLAERVGLRVEATVYDSGPAQFWGSELYQRGIALDDRPFRRFEDVLRVVAPRQRALGKRAAALNAAGEGDQAAFYLRLRSGVV